MPKMPKTTRKRWTAEDMAKLRNMAQKHPPAEIASQLGRSAGAINVKAHELKLSLRCRGGNDEGSFPLRLLPSL
jgi:hypothetical protein